MAYPYDYSVQWYSPPIIYTGRNNTFACYLRADGTIIADLSAITRAVVNIGNVAIDSTVEPTAFDWTTHAYNGNDLLTFNFGAYNLTPGLHAARLYLYSSVATSGLVYEASFTITVVEGESTGLVSPTQIDEFETFRTQLLGTDVAQQLKGVYYVSTSASITNHGDAAVTGSLAWCLAAKGTAAGVVVMPPKATGYVSSAAITIPANTLLVPNGNTLTFNVTGNSKALYLGGNNIVITGTFAVDVTGTSPSGSGESHCPVVIGDYGVGTGYKNININTLILSTNRSDGNGLLITGNSYAIRIGTIEFPASTTLGRGVLIHWGGANTPASGTYHPHDIEIGVVHGTGLTGMTTTSQGLVFLSSAYDVTVGYASGDVGCGLMVWAGDYGNQYASAAQQPFIGSGIRFNGAALTVSAYGVYTNGLPSVSGSVVPLPINAKGVKLVASGTPSDGIFVTYTDGSRWESCEASGFVNHGFRVGRQSRRGKIVGGSYYSNGKNGISFYDTTIAASDWDVVSPYVHSNNTASNSNSYDKAGIAIRNASQVRVRNGTFGLGTETQAYSIRVENTASNIYVNDNHTVALGGAAVAYSFGAGSDWNTMNVVGSNNTTAAGTLYGGAPLITLTGAGKRIISSSAAPTAGTWAVGDLTINTTPATAPAAGGTWGWTCTVAGTPGTWKEISITGAVPSAATTHLVVSVGTPSDTIPDVGAAFDQTTLNNVVGSLATKINSLMIALEAAKLKQPPP